MSRRKGLFIRANRDGCVRGHVREVRRGGGRAVCSAYRALAEDEDGGAGAALGLVPLGLGARVLPSPPPNRRGSHPFTVRPRSTSTKMRRPRTLRPSASLYASANAKRGGISHCVPHTRIAQCCFVLCCLYL
jgi:hypothetical protein